MRLSNTPLVLSKMLSARLGVPADGLEGQWILPATAIKMCAKLVYMWTIEWSRSPTGAHTQFERSISTAGLFMI